MANRGSAMSQLTCTKCGLMFMDIEGTIEEIPLKGGGSWLKPVLKISLAFCNSTMVR